MVPEIINIDYAPPALERMKAAEIARFGDTKTRWEVVDLLDWSATSQAISGVSDKPGLSLNSRKHTIIPARLVIIDKSTADAISCGPDIYTSLVDSGSSPVHPTEALALHLGALAAEGSIWLALSYSSMRFEFLTSINDHEREKLSEQEPVVTARHLWIIDRTELIPTQTEPNNLRENVHTPQVYHTLFTLKRTARDVFL